MVIIDFPNSVRYRRLPANHRLTAAPLLLSLVVTIFTSHQPAACVSPPIPSNSTGSPAVTAFSFVVTTVTAARNTTKNDDVPPLPVTTATHSSTTHRPSYDEMYKAISILQELFFPQWIQLLKEEHVIEEPDPPEATPSPTTATLVPPSTATIDGLFTAVSDLLFYNVSQPAEGAENTTLRPSTNNDTGFHSNHSVFNASDAMLSATADTVAELLRNITYLPVLPLFPNQGPFLESDLLANYTTVTGSVLSTPGGGCFGVDNCTGGELGLGRNYWALFLLVFPVLTIFGNVLVILSVFRERSLQTATNYFIVSLACADLFVAAGVAPFAVYAEVNKNYWDLGDSICDAWMACDVIASTCSIFNLTAISIDRFIAVTRPIKYARHKNHRRVVYTICIVWLVSCGIGMPIILGLNEPGHGKLRDPNLCAFYNADFILYSSLSSFYIPWVLMMILYWQIFKAIRQRAKKAASKKLHVHSGGGGCTGGGNKHVPAPISSTGGSGGTIPLVDTRWNGAQDSLTKHRLSVTGLSNSNKGPSTTDAHTNASSSFLVEGDDIDDIDQDSGAVNDAGGVTPTENGPKERLALPMGRRESLVSPDEDIVSPDVEEVTSKTHSFRKTAKLLSSALSPSSRGPPKAKGLENGNANLLGLYHGSKGGPFRNKNQLRRSMKTREKLLAKRERKATKTLAIVLGVFLFCWVPFFTANIINAICDKLLLNSEECPVGPKLFMVTTWLGYGNSFMNPVIYTVFNEEFRKAFLAILRCQSKFNS